MIYKHCDTGEGNCIDLLFHETFYSILQHSVESEGNRKEVVHNSKHHLEHLRRGPFSASALQKQAFPFILKMWMTLLAYGDLQLH